MNIQKILKVILGIIFVPLILGAAIVVIDLTKDGIEYVITDIIIEILLIWGYFKLNKKIDNMETNSKGKIRIIDKLRSKDKPIEEKIDRGYEKITDTFWINQEEKTLLINNKSFKFSQILKAELVEESMDKNTISGMGNSHGNFGSIYGVSLSGRLIHKLDIEIKTTDMSNAFISISFLRLGIRIGFNPNSKKYKEAYVKAQKCLSILQLIIKENNNLNKALT